MPHPALDLKCALCERIYDIKAIVDLARSQAWNATTERTDDGSEIGRELNSINRALDVASELLNQVAERIDLEVELVPGEVANG